MAPYLRILFILSWATLMKCLVWRLVKNCFSKLSSFKLVKVCSCETVCNSGTCTLNMVDRHPAVHYNHTNTTKVSMIIDESDKAQEETESSQYITDHHFQSLTDLQTPLNSLADFKEFCKFWPKILGLTKIIYNNSLPIYAAHQNQIKRLHLHYLFTD